MNIFRNNKCYSRFYYSSEIEFEVEIVENSKTFFGEKTIYINAKKKIDSKSLGGTIPDGFLFDLSDLNDPQFYLVEVELSKHGFFNHIFPQLTKFFAFFKNHKQQKVLIEKLYSLVSEDELIKAEFKKHIGSREIYKFLIDILDNSQNILLIIDGAKKELPEVSDIYTDTWGRMVKALIVQKFVNNGDIVYSMDPEYETLEYIEEEVTEPTTEIPEEYHLDGAQENVKAIYEQLKISVVKIDSGLIFNPQKYYISIKANKNICFIKVRKKKIRLIVMMSEDDIRQIVTHHIVIPLSAGVQGFYNGPCAAVDIENLDDFHEIRECISEVNKRSKGEIEIS